jgi:hypothetical protein
MILNRCHQSSKPTLGGLDAFTRPSCSCRAGTTQNISCRAVLRVMPKYRTMTRPQMARQVPALVLPDNVCSGAFSESESDRFFFFFALFPKILFCLPIVRWFCCGRFFLRFFLLGVEKHNMTKHLRIFFLTTNPYFHLH